MWKSMFALMICVALSLQVASCLEDGSVQQQLDALKQDMANLAAKHEVAERLVSDLTREIDGLKQANENSTLVAFYARLNSDSIIEDGSVIIFDNAILNVGGKYSAPVGIFQCPVDGYYFFSCALQSFTARSKATFMMGEDEIQRGPLTSHDTGGSGSGWFSGHSSMSIITYCAQNSIVYMRATSYSSALPAAQLLGEESTFMGFLMEKV